ncbi:MAG: shikimate kinase [Gemmataceae bacterium]
MRLALIGPRGSGKTALGRLLAPHLDCPFLDADAELQRRTGRSIAVMFAEEGEAGFRNRESALLAELLQQPRFVLSTGGGVVLRETNRRLLSSLPYVIWLQAEPAVLWQRLQADPASATTRPNLAGGGLAEIEQVVTARNGLYAAVATHQLDTTRLSPEEALASVLALLARAQGDS